jgi:RNA polymerase sigma-70 factor (family 1)
MQGEEINTELFEKLAAGDEQAFRRVFHYYAPRLLHFVLDIVKSEAVAEEIVQDVFMKLWMNREAVAEKDNPSSWLFTVASHQAITFLRRMSVERRFIDHIKQQVQEARLLNPTEDQLLLRENEALLYKAMNTLPPQQKLIYKMSRWDKLTHKEIADRLDISPNTVKNHIVTAVQSITDFIRKAGSFIFFTIFFYCH